MFPAVKNVGISPLAADLGLGELLKLQLQEQEAARQKKLDKSQGAGKSLFATGLAGSPFNLASGSPTSRLNNTTLANGASATLFGQK